MCTKLSGKRRSTEPSVRPIAISAGYGSGSNKRKKPKPNHVGQYQGASNTQRQRASGLSLPARWSLLVGVEIERLEALISPQILRWAAAYVFFDERMKARGIDNRIVRRIVVEWRQDAHHVARAIF